MFEKYIYAMKLTPDKRDGGYVVTCRDLPEAITQGESIEDALLEAADCLEEAIAARIDDGRPIPAPSAPRRGEHLVSAPCSAIPAWTSKHGPTTGTDRRP